MHVPLLLVFDDSLHNRWKVDTLDGALLQMDAENYGWSSAVPCSQSMRMSFTSPTQAVILRADEPISIPDANILLLSLRPLQRTYGF